VRVLLYTGKGGVGKTSLALASALCAAEHGHRVFVLSTDSAHSLGDALGRSVGPRPVEVAERVVAQEVATLAELDRSWSAIEQFFRELLTDEEGPLAAEELLVFPGMDELVSLRAIKQVEDTGDFDVCVVDCAPTGSTLKLLRLPDVLRFFMDNFFDFKRKAARLLRPIAERVGVGRFVASDEVFAAFDRLYGEIEDVRQILLDVDRTSARLVVNPTRVVVAETRRSFAYLSLYGVATDAVLVNRVLPERASGGYFARWAERERGELAAIEQSFPVPLFQVPLYPREPIGVDALRDVARAMFGERDPAELFTRTRPIRLEKRGGRTVLEIDIANAVPGEVDVVARGGELLVRLRDFQRRISLPDSLAGRPVGGVAIQDGVLTISFETSAGPASATGRAKMPPSA
jgi:arsenite-transporting ATPase